MPLLVFAALLGANGSTARADGPPAPRLVWEETFPATFAVGTTWGDPAKHDLAFLQQIYTQTGAGLHARYDGTSKDPPPAVHLGHGFGTQKNPNQRLADACILQWKWRVLQHPAVTSDAWKDVAASVYVVFRTPTLLRGGEGFKFGWLAKPGAVGQTQHGIVQIERRHDPAVPTTSAFVDERVDLCALYTNTYGAIGDTKLLYVGVVTDGDGTKSIAEADYANFRLTDR